MDKLVTRLDAGKLAVVEHLFSYHQPDDAKVAAMREIRAKAKELAILMVAYSPRCDDQTSAIRKLREAVQTVNAAITLDGISL